MDKSASKRHILPQIEKLLLYSILETTFLFSGRCLIFLNLPYFSESALFLIIIYTMLFYIYIKYSRIKNTLDSLKGNRIGISPSVDVFLDDHSDEPIVQLLISRNVVSPLITETLNILSPNFKKKNNNNPLYHLKILIKTDRTSLSVEKNDRITISRY
jgi:hypothetical protein